MSKSDTSKPQMKEALSPPLAADAQHQSLAPGRVGPAEVELALFAPYNETVEILGDFTDWKARPMSRGEDGWWRCAVSLSDGDHAYKFRVKSLSYFALGETLDVFDPYSLAVRGEGKDEKSIVSVRGGKRVWTEYEWKHDHVPLPQNHELVIYELFVGDFAGKPQRRGQFSDVVARLDELRALGINCLELMPVKFFPGTGWGYNLRSLFAVAPDYGTPDELCQLVDECHARGMRVIIDGVYNHADADSPLAKIAYAYWYHEKNPDPPEMQWGPKFNYDHFDANLKVYPARKYVTESVQFWVEKFHIDGIRLDATRAIASFDFLRELTAAAFAKVDGRKPFITIAEHVPEDPAITGYPDGPLVASWRFSLGAQFRAALTDHPNDGASPFDLSGFLKALDPATNGYATGGRCINYIVSHDHDRLMRQLGDQGHMFDGVAFARCRLGMALLATAPGMPMLWMGQEFGAASEKSLEPRPLDWSLLKNDSNRELRDYSARMLKLRHENPALHNDSFQVCFEHVERRLFAFKRWNEEGNVVLVVGTFRHDPSGEMVIADCGLLDGKWREYGLDREVEVRNGTLEVELGPSEVKVFVKAP